MEPHTRKICRPGSGSSQSSSVEIDTGDKQRYLFMILGFASSPVFRIQTTLKSDLVFFFCWINFFLSFSKSLARISIKLNCGCVLILLTHANVCDTPESAGEPVRQTVITRRPEGSPQHSQVIATSGRRDTRGWRTSKG